MGGLRRAWHRLAEQARRITGFSTPFGGIQLRPPSDTSFSRAQDERQLMDEIWLLAGSEAYRAQGCRAAPARDDGAIKASSDGGVFLLRTRR